MIITLFIEITNEGKTYVQRLQVLDDFLSQYNVTFEKVYEKLDNDAADPDYLFFIGYLNFSGNGTPLNSALNPNAAFNYFQEASSQYQHSTAQYYLGICYENGIGTKED